MRVLPILFNTDMVQAILEGRKTVTRRVVKRDMVDAVLSSPARMANPDISDDKFIKCLCTAPCEPGDILYVRETWYKDAGRYMYRADYSDGEKFYRNGKEVVIKWRPSIHMPKEAARLFLRVTDVRVERLKDIMLDPPGPNNQVVKEGLRYGSDFIATWENTLKPTDRSTYGWDANPWVWVIEFERISKEDALKGGGENEHRGSN